MAEVNAEPLATSCYRKLQCSQIIFLSQNEFNFEHIQAAPSIFGVNLFL